MTRANTGSFSAFAPKTVLLLALALSAPAFSASTRSPADLSCADTSVDVISGAISRRVVTGTSVRVEVQIAPVGFTFNGT